MKAHGIVNKKELIKALRCCIVDFNSTQSRLCNECQYGIYADGKKACENKVKRDAADALEAAEKRIAELEKSYSWKAYAALEESIEGYKTRIAELEDDKKVMIKVIQDKSDFHRTKDAMRIAELEAQMPKEGEWIESEDLESAMKGKVACSICGEPQFALELTNEFVRMKNQKTNYCPNCRAKMKGANDEAD